MNTSSFYQSVAMIIVRVIPRNAVSRLMGRFASSTASRPFIGLFAKAVKIDLGEAEKDISEYPTLTAFFTRHLKPGTRMIDAARDILVSPVDGVLAEAGPLDADTTFTVKGRRFNAGTLLGCPEGQYFAGGGYSVHYLSPRDYHWIHSPQDGFITGWTHMPGDCLPVFPKAVEKFDGLFTRNERVIVRMDGHLGDMAVAMVAAMGVGNIKLAFTEISTNNGGIPGHSDLTESIPSGRGDRLGVFMLGSTVVLLWKNPRIAIDRTKVGTHLRMGEAFASLRSD
jgi:phosphatidylserine decarboxylase